MQSYRCRSIKKPADSPSFSSSLLDSIYRSIDDNDMKKKQSSSSRENTFRSNEEDNKMKLRIIQKWMDKKDFKKQLPRDTQFLSLHSSSSSSASSSGGFSSSEAESFPKVKESRMAIPRPVLTCISSAKKQPRVSKKEEGKKSMVERLHNVKQPRVFKEGKKSTPERLRNDKQPNSPGAKLASFLNSLFNKRKQSSSSPSKSMISTQSSSSSCLSKAPSMKKVQSAGKRSVRFYPISVIVDEDSRPCGHKNLHEQKFRSTIDSRNEVKDQIIENSRRAEKFAKDLLNRYQQKIYLDLKDRRKNETEYEDDCASCSSSDLFELDNLSIVGADRYQEELPVYETTYLHSNRSITSSLIP